MPHSLLKIKFFIWVLLLPSAIYAQIGGQRSFEFLNVPTNTRLTSLGGVNASLANEDLNFAFSNPALTSDSLSGMVSFNYLSYFADINAASFIYQHDFNQYGSWFIGAKHFDYGSIEETDPTGVTYGEYDASETMLIVGRSHTVGNFSVGGSLKFINARLAEYSSNALAFDIGGVFKHPNRNLSVALVFKNLGFVISDYTAYENSKVPFDIQLGATFKPEHMPFRFSISAYNLYKTDIAYFNPNNTLIEDEPGTVDKVFRHFTFGAELLLTKNVNLRAGYNHLVRQELKLEGASGGAGFSFGLMFRIKSFEFSYSRGGYHPAGGSHNFGLAANTNLFFKKK